MPKWTHIGAPLLLHLLQEQQLLKLLKLSKVPV
jgi:hypothetical protein